MAKEIDNLPDRPGGGGSAPGLDDSSLAGEVLEQIDTPIVVLDLDGRILLFNAACRRLTGYDQKDAIGRRVWDFLLLPEEIGNVQAVFDETSGSDVPTHFINYWLTRDGEKRLLKWSNFRTKLPSGRELHVLATGIDITDMVAAENALADREAHLRSIVDTSPEAIVTIDGEGIIRSFSPAAEKTFGYDAKEIIGQNIKTLMPEPYASEHDDYLKRYRETGVPRIIGRKRVVSARHKDGGTFPIRLSVGEFHQHDRPYFVGFIEDISREQETRERLQTMQADLDRYSRMSVLGEMASSIAHELNQPLTAAAAFMEATDLLLAQQGRDADDPVRGEVSRGLTEIHRTAEIIRNIREFIRRGTPDVKPQDVNPLVRDAMLLALAGPLPEHLETDIDLAEGLPQVALDRVQFQQVMINLIRNAVESMIGHMPQRLSISSKQTAKFVEIRVTDTGAGIDPAMEGRLFDAFATNKNDGLGLGLTIARTIVEGHQGELIAEPNDPHGMVFTVRLPTGTEASS